MKFSAIRPLVFSLGFSLSPMLVMAQQNMVSPAAQQAAAANDYKLALEELTALLAKDPRNEAALTTRANLYNKVGQPDKALADAQTVRKLNAQNTDAVFIAGTSFIMLRQPAQAIKYFDTALVLKPNWLQALQFRGKLLVQATLYEQAIADLTRVIAMAPDGAEAYLLRARAYTKKYRNEEALTDYITVTKLAPEGSKLYEIAKEEIQVPLKEYEDWKAAGGSGGK